MLTYVDLDENGLSGSIPPEIGQLMKLEALYLSSNKFSGNIPPEVGHPQTIYLKPQSMGNTLNKHVLFTHGQRSTCQKYLQRVLSRLQPQD